MPVDRARHLLATLESLLGVKDIGGMLDLGWPIVHRSARHRWAAQLRAYMATSSSVLQPTLEDEL